MAKAKITEKQWEEIRKIRSEKGTPYRTLAKQYGVTENAIRKRIGAQDNKQKKLAKQLATTELEIEQLDFGAQKLVRTNADKIKNLYRQVSNTIEIFANTAEKMAIKANKLASEEGNESLRDAFIAQKTANEALVNPMKVIEKEQTAQNIIEKQEVELAHDFSVEELKEELKRRGFPVNAFKS